MENNTNNLDHLLDAVRQAGAAKFTDEKKKIYADGISSVANSGVLEKALNIGDKAPNFSLKNALDQSVGLYDELKNGPVVLTWYRGGWCPYCNITLHALQEILPEIKSENATLIALTPELPDNSLSTSEKNQLEFDVLSDVHNTIGKEFGVVYSLTEEVAASYNAGFDLNKFNGDTSNELPLAATYVIDTNGVIQYAFLDADYTVRAEPQAILAALKNLK
ncbi:peroxiredoxin-like family protein [Frigoriflavimonas asaccharolytica]|uniref:thioredoxin-dependent peroxiredoxin n=2 Tax=Frigoriflavimonas asaccharolytica TaxID=2735899 RepID=A0A8J8GAJ3_9FLAO|nr:peroxiredoxin-like family protein [Frigoriflavimonas asaccharolytica]NRS94043.1 peroxiredoxin [Frigoriflavimonas asaccharolytica]